MIVGNGLLAKAFQNVDRSNVVFFASGVSNSLETRAEEFAREKNLILETLAQNSDKIFVYFSTCSIYDSSKNTSLYVNHKLNMERLIEKQAASFLIVRVSNAVGFGGNPNLLLNYLHQAIQSETCIPIHIQATRNLIDVDDIQKIVVLLLDSNCINTTENLAYLHEFSIVEIVEQFEKIIQKTVQKSLVNQGQSYSIHLNKAKEYFLQERKDNKESYLHSLITKYYS